MWGVWGCSNVLLNQLGDIANFYIHLFDAALESNGFVLELGPGKGDGSTVAFDDALSIKAIDNGPEGNLHITVDQLDYMDQKPERDWWHLVIGDTRDRNTLLKVERIALGRCPGLIFVDTEHTPEQIAVELELYSTMADEDTVWLFHDTYMFGIYNPMTDAIKEFANKHGWVYDDVSTEPHGLGRMRKVIA